MLIYIWKQENLYKSRPPKKPSKKKHIQKNKKNVVCKSPCFLILHLSPVGILWGHPSPQGSEERQGLMAKGQSGLGPALSWRSTRGKVEDQWIVMRCFFADATAHHIS